MKLWISGSLIVVLLSGTSAVVRADQLQDQKTASDRLQAALSAELDCETSSVQKLDDGVSDAATIAEAVLYSCAATLKERRAAWKNSYLANTEGLVPAEKPPFDPLTTAAEDKAEVTTAILERRVAKRHQ